MTYSFDHFPTNILYSIQSEIRKHGNYFVRLVGGSVRDLFMNELVADYDFATDAPPEVLLKCGQDETGWKILPTGIDHGTVTFMSLLGSFEVTSLRQDVETDGRHAKVEFTSDWMADAERRDFTINAMYLDQDQNMYDYFGGQQDMNYGILRFVGDAKKRLEEDGLRIIRYVRLKNRLGFKYVPEEAEIVKENLHLLKNISVERVWQEIKKAAKYPESFYMFISDMEHFGIFKTLDIRIQRDRLLDIMNCKTFVAQYPAMVMGSITTTSYPHGLDNPQEIEDILKFSSEEAKQAKYFRRGVKHEYSAFVRFTRNVEEVSETYCRNFAVWTGWKPLINYLDTEPKHTFPVNGHDLLELGFSGKGLGIAMENLKSTWHHSHYTKTKEELLEHAKGYSSLDRTYKVS